MKIKSIKLINYVGIYNGMGLEEIFIDFNRCVNRTVIIKGKNGAGKSTLFNALHPLPDANNKLVPGKYAEKHIVVSDNNFDYDIIIKHPVKDNGDRETTKAYIEKLMPVGREQLNPNGNVSSFKEILYSEFSLDPNFVALSQLSGEDRGLVDKTPSERKKFVNTILDCLEVYNDIHKTLTKRSSVFKSIMNNLTSKIGNIGDKEKLNLTLVSLENRLNKLLSEKDDLIQQLALDKSKIKLLDPDATIQNTYDIIYNNIVKINNDLVSIDSKISTVLSKLNIDKDSTLDDIMKIYTSTKNMCLELETNTNIKENQINTLLSNREVEAKELQTKTAKLIALESEKNYIDIDKEIEITKQKLFKYSTMINRMGINESISRDEFIMGLNTVKDIKDSVDIFKSGADMLTVNKAVVHVKNNTYPTDLIQIIDRDISEANDSLKALKYNLEQFKMKKEIASKLSMRPNNCTINACEFIKDSLEASLLEPEVNIEKIETNIHDTNIRLEILLQEREELDKIIECINYLNSLCRNIERSSLILNKLPIANLFIKENILDMIINHYSFKEIDELYQYIDHANIIDEYKLEKIKLSDLESDYKVFKSKKAIIDEIMTDIDSLNKKLDGISLKIESDNITIKENKIKIANFKSLITELDVLISLFNERKTMEITKVDLASKFNNIKTSIVEIKGCINNIEKFESQIKSIESQITPIINDRDKIKHGLVLLEEYKQELSTYTTKFDKVETIKKFSSPSQGIQVLFMSLYMNKTITLANQLLGLMFDGEYVLGQFIINEKEFKIPCIGGGLANDDISSMSTSQKCMISMIISFVMLQQSSTKYNILKLDEIDGGLDTRNRLQFLHVLDQLINMLNVEQCIMISHNTEMDLSNCDIIQLKLNEGEEINSGNIIYKY